MSQEKRILASRESRSWVRPELRQVGDVATVLKSGGGKLSTAEHDPGEVMRKPCGQEPPGSC